MTSSNRRPVPRRRSVRTRPGGRDRPPGAASPPPPSPRTYRSSYAHRRARCGAAPTELARHRPTTRRRPSPRRRAPARSSWRARLAEDGHNTLTLALPRADCNHRPMRLPAGVPHRARTAPGIAVLALIAVVLPAATQPAGAADPAHLGIHLAGVASGLDQPVAIAQPNDGSGRLFIVEQPGRIRVWRPGSGLLSTPYLDIHTNVPAG